MNISLFPAGPIRRKTKQEGWRTEIGPSPLPRARDVLWDELVVLLTRFRSYPPIGLTSHPKLRVDCWSPASYAPSVLRRSSAAVEEVCALVLDFDNGVTFEESLRVWGEWTHIGHTSWSHTEGHHKFRLVLPLARQVPGAEWHRAWAWALALWGEEAPRRAGGAICGTPDEKCKDASRIYFLPALRAGQERLSWHHEGSWGWLDIPWEDEPPAPPPAPIRPVVRAVVEDWQFVREASRRLNEEPAARRDLGAALGGSVGEDRVRHVKCPQCGEKSVWWLIRPQKKRTASCNHRESCGGWWWLYDLALLHGVAEAA